MVAFLPYLHPHHIVGYLEDQRPANHAWRVDEVERAFHVLVVGDDDHQVEGCLAVSDGSGGEIVDGGGSCARASAGMISGLTLAVATSDS